MKKRIVSFFLVLAMCAALLPTIALADDVTVLRQADFSDDRPEDSPVTVLYGSYVLPSGSYKLSGNITLDCTIQIPYGAAVTLDLNGCTLLRSRDGDLTAISFQYDDGYKGTLTLEDSSAGQTDKISGGKITVESGCTFIMNGGTICKADIGVSNDGDFTMNGGKITDCDTIIKNKSDGTVELKEGTTLEGTVQIRGRFPFKGITFTGKVEHGGSDNTEFGGTDNSINGGIFRCPVENGFRDASFWRGTIKGGVFYKEVNNNAFNGSSAYKYSTIEGGVFYGNVTNMKDASHAAEINGGVFYGEVVNEGIINGGVFLGGISGNGTKPDTSHKITLYFNDDAPTVKEGVVVGNMLYPLGEPDPDIKREGYTFAGWYWDADFKNPVNFDEQIPVKKGMTLYAKWKSEAEADGEGFVIAGGLLSGLLEGAANVLDETFVDVSRGAYYYNAVEWAHNKGIAGGVDKKHFAPDESCTRAQAVTMLWRAAGCPAVWTENPFEDVDADDYYYEAVLWAVANGITSGADETHFSPDAPCTRGQIVTLLHRAARCYDAHESFGFVDVKTGSYCEDAINWAVANGITNGTDVETFSPDAPCTRAQIVTFLYRNR